MGTTVTALLPVTDKETSVARPPRRAPTTGGGETVLVVEDEAAMREVTRRILHRNGYRVLLAANGHEAIDAVDSHPAHIDVLLTDVIMPQMLGKEVADRIRQVRPEVAVLFMSGYTQGVLDTQGVLEPGVNLIEKPFSESSLLIKLREVIDAHGSR